LQEPVCQDNASKWEAFIYNTVCDELKSLYLRSTTDNYGMLNVLKYQTFNP